MNERKLLQQEHRRHAAIFMAMIVARKAAVGCSATVSEGDFLRIGATPHPPDNQGIHDPLAGSRGVWTDAA